MSLETDIFVVMSKALPLPLQLKYLEQFIAAYRKNPTSINKQNLGIMCLMISNHVADENLSMDQALERDRQLSEWMKIMPKGN